MSIKERAYGMCKDVRASLSRPTLKAVLAGLDAGQFGYLARNQNIQFLGYLMVDKKRSAIENGPFPIQIPPLAQEDLSILETAHSELVLLNRRCISPLVDQLKLSEAIVDPYNRYEYSLPSGTADASFASAEATDAVVSSFKNHPALSIAIDSRLPQMSMVSKEQYVKSMLTFDEILNRVGVFHAPKELTDMMRGESHNSPGRIVTRHFIALVCIRASLSILDQMVFQAILRDKPAFFSEENVIAIKKSASNLVSRGLAITYQPTEETLFVQCTELVLVKLKGLGMESAELWRVEAIQSEFSQDFGEQITIDLRNVDDNLNPFAALLQFL